MRREKEEAIEMQVVGVGWERASPGRSLPALTVQGGAGTSGLVRQDGIAAALCEHKQAGSSQAYVCVARVSFLRRYLC